MSSFYSERDRQFEEYLRDGITAAKAGQRKLAELLLNRALYIRSNDARPYIWLSSTTDDPHEQIEYLEKAVAIEPGNAAARRGLAQLKGKLDPERMRPIGVEDPRGSGPTAEVEVAGKPFLCPKCGGRMAFSIQAEGLRCDYCGYIEKAAENPGFRAESAEQVMDFYLPTDRGHRWSSARQLLRCERCGAQNVLPPGHRHAECAYCGSNQLIETPEQADLIDPQAIGLMSLDSPQVENIARRWLKSGWLSPDSLGAAAGSLHLRPAYYSCWTFDGTLELNWACEVAESGGSTKSWTPARGVETRFFNDVLVSGIKSLPTRELERLEPFHLFDLKEFQPDYVAGWPVIIYDVPLSDASLIGREKTLADVKPEIIEMAAVGREKRNVSVGAGSWSGLTFKHILLPIWIGTYRFGGKEYRLFINGQTGKVVGAKPRDQFKTVMLGIIALMLLFLAVLAYWGLMRGGG